MHQLPLFSADLSDVPTEPLSSECQTVQQAFLTGYDRLNPDKKDLLRTVNFDFNTGWSDYYELPQEYRDARCGNGDGWLRFDNGDLLGASLVIRIVYENEVHMINDPIQGKVYEKDGLPTTRRNNGSRVGIKFEGYVENFALKPPIKNPTKMRSLMEEAGIPKQCALTGLTSNLELDHKQGRPFLQPDGSISWEDTGDPQNIQYLTRSANQMKCRICMECRTTNLRPSGRNFNLSLEYLEGTSEFEVKGPGCKGCPLHDPRAFQDKLDALLKSMH